MTYTPKFSLVIPFRYKPDRLLNLRRTLDWASGFNECETILVEQDKNTKISHLGLKAIQIFTYNDGGFNRSWGLNVGLKYAKSNVIIFSDADLIMNPQDLIDSIAQLQHYDFVNPYQSVIDLTLQESGLPLEQIFNGVNRAGRGENDNQRTNLCGGMCIFKKEAIYRIGGWNQNFRGWGAEDDFQAIKVKHFLTWKQMSYKSYHLYHERGQIDQNLYSKNLELLNQLANLPPDQIDHISRVDMPKMGALNLYS